MARFDVAIDPGLRGCGMAIFRDKVLHRAQYVKNPYTSGNDADCARAMRRAITEAFIESTPVEAGRPHTLWYEVPRSYKAGSQKGSQNDLIDLAGFVYAIACSTLFEEAALIRYFPRDWKGTLDADDMIKRIEARLKVNPYEWANVVDAGALSHNVIDACGIGLFGLGRLQPKRVFDFGGGT